MRKKLLISLLISPFIFAINGYCLEKIIRTTCGDGSNFSITYKSEKIAFIEVNSNQIYINTKIKRSNNQEEFVLINPGNLGRGGMMLNWDNFSREKSVLTMNKVDSKRYLAYWHGFFDEEKSSYVWSEKSDLVGGIKGTKNSYYLYECQSEKDKKELLSVNLLIDGIENHNDFLVVVQQIDDKKKLKAFINSQHRIEELIKEFSSSTTINNVRFIDSQQSLIALFYAVDNEWAAKYCWDISANNLFFAAKKIGSEKIHYSKNINSNSQCTLFIKN